MTTNSPYVVYTGYAAVDLPNDTITLEVICPDLTPNATSGSIAPGITTISTSLTDRDGNAISTQSTSANHIVATWDGENGRRYPGRVRKGEPVRLFKYAGQDKWKWLEGGEGRTYRTTDRLHMEIGATDPSKPGVEKNNTNTYSVFMDSEEQKLGFTTSKANGEAIAFSCQADMKAGTFHISDDTEGTPNRLFIDTGSVSGTPCFQMNVSTGGTIKLDGENLLIQIPKCIMIQGGERIVFNSPLTVLNLGQSGSVIINAANVAINAARSFIATAASIGLNGAVKAASLVTGMARIGNATKGAAGSDYTAVKVSDPKSTPAAEPSNSPDSTPGSIPYSTS